MKVFLSWSGNVSHRVALVFRDWLPSVIQTIDPYVSSEDIDKGARWSTDIAKELEDSTFGILCVTKENIDAPWLTFEAGALSKTMDKSFVSPFLFDIKRSEVDGPILQFQSTIFQKNDIKKLLDTINKASETDRLTEERLSKAFEVWYPTLEEELKKLAEVKAPTVIKEVKTEEFNDLSNEILEEILDLTRSNQKLLRNPDNRITELLEHLKMMLIESEERNKRLKSSYPISRRKRLSPVFFEEMMHISPAFSRSYIGLQIALSVFKDDFPWIYDAGKEVIEVLKAKKPKAQKIEAINEFSEIMEVSFDHPIMRDYHRHSKEHMMLVRELPHMFREALEK